jgi:hypothetical protein
METVTHYTTSILLSVLVTAPFASAQETPAHSGKIETRRLGTLEFEGDYVTEETADKLREELKFQAAVQTYLWSFPIANVIALRGRNEVAEPCRNSANAVCPLVPCSRE